MLDPHVLVDVTSEVIHGEAPIRIIVHLDIDDDFHLVYGAPHSHWTFAHGLIENSDKLLAYRFADVVDLLDEAALAVLEDGRPGAYARDEAFEEFDYEPLEDLEDDDGDGDGDDEEWTR